jgi:hypothetical protein
VFTNKQTCFQDGSQVKGTVKSLVISLKTLPRFFFTVLNNLTSPRRVTFLGRPTLGMFSTLPVLLYFFQIERIVDSGILSCLELPF